MILIKDEHQTVIKAEFNSGEYKSCFIVADNRIPNCLADENNDLFYLLECAIAAAIRKVLNNQNKEN